MHSHDDLANILDELAAERSAYRDGSGTLRYSAASIQGGLVRRLERGCGDAPCDAARAAYGMVLRPAPKPPPFDSPVRYALVDPANELRAEHHPTVAALAHRVTAPRARARLHDALWVARRQLRDRTDVQPCQHARRAVADYLATAASPGFPASDGAKLLGRAFVLALELRSDKLCRDVMAAVVRAFDAAAASPKLDSGLLFDLAPLLVEGHAFMSEADDARERIASLHAVLGDAWPGERERVFELQEYLTSGDAEGLERLKRERIAMLRELAPRCEGGVRLLTLQRALHLARTIPRAEDLRVEIEAEIGAIPPETFNVGKIEFDIDFPAVADVLAPGDDGTFEGAAASLISRLTEVFAVSSGDRAGWHAFLPFIRLDGRGYPLPGGDPSLADVEASISDSYALLAIAVPHLDEMRRRATADGAPIAAKLEGPYISEAHADAFARSLEHYWNDRFDDAVALALPLIESVLRTVLASAGGAIRTSRDEYRSLGAILGDDALSAVSSEEWREWFRASFTHKRGRNLRNIFAHGELGPARLDDVVLVLVATLYLATLPEAQIGRADQRDGGRAASRC